MYHAAEREMPPARMEPLPGMCPHTYTYGNDAWSFMCCDRPPHEDRTHHDPMDGDWYVTYGTA